MYNSRYELLIALRLPAAASFLPSDSWFSFCGAASRPGGATGVRGWRGEEYTRRQLEALVCAARSGGLKGHASLSGDPRDTGVSVSYTARQESRINT